MESCDVRGLSFGYGDELLLSDISFSLESGSITGIIGPNGAGKSTLLKLLNGILSPSTGSIEVGGVDVSDLTSRERAQRIGYVPQEELVTFPYSVRMMVAFGRHPYATGQGRETPEDTAAIEQALKLTGIDHLANRSCDSLSGGELHRVLLARTVAQDTGILMLDEPNAFLDIKYQIQVFDLISKLRAQHGKTILCVTHDLNLAAQYFERILLLTDGRIVEDGAPAEVLKTEILERHYGIGVDVHTMNGVLFVHARRSDPI